MRGSNDADEPSLPETPLWASIAERRSINFAWFLFWLACGLVVPTVMIALGVHFERRTPYTHDGPSAVRPWPANLIEPLCWVQIVHAVFGIVLLRGRRWLALGAGLSLVIAAFYFGLYAIMKITGIWL